MPKFTLARGWRAEVYFTTAPMGLSFCAASFQPVGEEELALHHAPGTKTGLLSVQEVNPGCYQAKIRKSGRGFVPLPGCNSVLLAAWLFARAVKSREDGTLETSNFKTSMKEVRPLAPLLPLY